MKQQDVIAALGALAQDSRLEVFRLLVRTGKDGLAAGDIAQRLGIPASSLSFHLSQLHEAGLVTQRREGRSLIYSADYPRMNALMAFLTENCCEGEGCEANDGLRSGDPRTAGAC
ncbi:metalloregulator ArsR/SmtB family transcription factor [Erythrobacter westpacificensis]|uniref:Metalloregulator ArsR/SmtB family transcription factor n=1 Tax=Erythrobacter westpacificensis TaxID=1055231 RepID=A0ABP9K163_9SPHN